MSAELAEIRETALERGDKPSSLRVYRGFRGFLRRAVVPWLPVEAEQAKRLDLPGPTVLAPVHRSHLDSLLVACFSERRIRALGKESLFTVPVVGYMSAALGAIPVRRGEAASDAMKAAKMLLDRGESMIVFPEGTRQAGSSVGELFDGAAWLAARTGARVIPIGIAGTGEALPSGAKFIHRSPVAIVVAEPMEPPVPSNGKRASRDDLAAYTDQLHRNLQAAQDRAETKRAEMERRRGVV